MSTKIIESVSIITVLGILLRWAVSFHPYSGAGKPPMYGDYEAQRHWQEITLNLPVASWYTNSTDNDLLYWGLDYPPLTAYHSYLNAWLAWYLNPDYVALSTSRGYESPEHKLFMRYTVLIADLCIFIPAALLFMRVSSGLYLYKVAAKFDFLALMTYPGLILIDYGHFQYNNVSLGLFVAAVAALTASNDTLGAALFSFALNYKQMELYHALPFFFFLLAKCTAEKSWSESLIKLATIGGTVVLVFVILWSPYLTSIESLTQLMNRVFPINRGLFEDKVASVWCSLSIAIKFKELVNNFQMAKLCLVTTGLLSLPSCINLFQNGTIAHFKYSLVNVSFIFFLFSFHVHEKSILLVAIPACLLFSSESFMTSWFLGLTVFSMIPLLEKDGLFIASVALMPVLMIVYQVTVAHCQSLSLRCALTEGRTSLDVFLRRRGLVLFRASFALCVVLTLIYKCVQPPVRYPDLFSVLIAIVSCAHFLFFALYFHVRQFSLSKAKGFGKKKK
ncbi:hypothetical protein HAZT_HAZT005819 [Hyalella azteca]|uniref:Alpha-1,3-glucosyltransferase n=1 Tax=Hyalella azteca TaxID=294128 RepID=A0A6A0HBQ5_HYAAZ|nr:dolichyl pyrophosphate Man9GlcNAc2 alpha-1,3-glucosyltransferase isoform X1 [Hyalella azteca]KAA0203193.1 hypothetical protein HAZT_HAZT005819 [Hyalella azteca]